MKNLYLVAGRSEDKLANYGVTDRQYMEFNVFLKITSASI
jgi:hypothetical protein